MSTFAVMNDYEYTVTHKRERITVWSGSFASTFEADGFSLPSGKGYTLTTYNDDKVRVTCPSPRTDENYRDVDAAVSAALTAHYDAIGARTVTPDIDEVEGLTGKYLDLWRENMPRVSGCMYFAIPGEQPLHVSDEQARRILAILSEEE